MCTFSVSESFILYVGWLCVSRSCSGCVGLWCPSMRGGVVVGSQGEGGRRRSIPDRGGVRVCRRIGERVFVVGGSGRLVCGVCMCVCMCVCVCIHS